ncbi:MAG: hypothetical protein ACRELY_18835 [Polyangiaceae bacterium]
MKRLSISLFAFFVPLAAACSSGSFPVGTDQSGATGDPSVDGGSCSSDNDCASGEQCAFKVSDACEAKGRCFNTQGLATCAAYSPGCSCDGSPANMACQPFPDGWNADRILHAGACNSGAADGGGAPCVTTSDCVGDQMECAYNMSQGCAAQGYCVSVAGVATCAAYSAGCACDGSEINVACTYPDGTASKPLAHSGNCIDGGF